MGFAADMILAAVVLLALFLGYRRGFFRSMVDLLGTVLVLGVSIWLSGIAAQWAFQEFFRAPMIAQIEVAIESTGAEQAAEAAVACLPGMFSGALELYGVTMDSIREAIAGASGSAAVAAVDLMAPAVVAILKAILTLVLFIFLMVVMRILAGAVCRVLRLPLLRQLDRGLGALLGAVQGLVVVFLLCFCVQILAPVSSPWLREMAEGSRLCAFFATLIG